MYFLFSPTLIYRDSYIKAPSRNYKKLFYDLVNFLGTIYFVYILFKVMLQPQIFYLNHNLSLYAYIQTLFKFMVPGTLLIFLLFYGLMHCWFNAWSEIMRFPDRQCNSAGSALHHNRPPQPPPRSVVAVPHQLLRASDSKS